ncbi:MAG: hypothetical protein ACKOFW_12145 [Planctomycetaceae bacterium]
MAFYILKGNDDMNVDIFVGLLAEAAPSLHDLGRCGLVGEQANDFVKSFLARRCQPPPFKVTGLAGLEGLQHWDLSNVEIGMVRFPNQPSNRLGGVLIGCVESDPLVLISDTGEIVVQEFGTPDHVLWFVARNGESMLDALVIAANFLSKRAVGRIDLQDHEAIRSVVIQCSTAAGGEKYLDFFRMLLGAD